MGQPPHACPVRFMLDGEVVEARDLPPTRTLLQFLREDLGRTGTKEGCAEGDCGACTVVIGELGGSADTGSAGAGNSGDSGDGESIRYSAVNACIRFLPTLDGREVITAESLAAPDGSLHPVQRAMVDCHASQCGFCTPGFVMSLLALYLNRRSVSRDAVVDALAGNLCRCTGYRPIIEAGCRMHDYPEPAAWSRADAQSEPRRAALRSLRANRGIRENAAAPAAEVIAGFHGGLQAGFHAPRSAAEVARLRLEWPDALLLAGGTDIGLWVTKQMRELPPLIYIGEATDLKQVRVAAGELEIGAAVNLEAAYAAIVAHYPTLAELANRFASPPIRNSGTLCGNLANGSPIGDSMPALIALGASLLLRRGDTLRTLALEDFYLGYQQKDLQAGEFVSAVRVPLPVAVSPGSASRHIACYKVSKRFDQDISAVCSGYAVDIADGRITAARIAYGGMASTPQRARRTEAALLGQPWTAAGIAAALPLLAEDFQPISDMRAGGAYRLQVAMNLLRRFQLEYGGGVDTKEDSTSGVDAAGVNEAGVNASSLGFARAALAPV